MKVRTTVEKRGGVQAVAAMVGVTQWTVYQWVKEDRLPVYAAEILKVKPRGRFKSAPTRGRHVPSGSVKAVPVKRSWWQRLIDWMIG